MPRRWSADLNQSRWRESGVKLIRALPAGTRLANEVGRMQITSASSVRYLADVGRTDRSAEPPSHFRRGFNTKGEMPFADSNWSRPHKVGGHGWWHTTRSRPCRRPRA